MESPYPRRSPVGYIEASPTLRTFVPNEGHYPPKWEALCRASPALHRKHLSTQQSTCHTIRAASSNNQIRSQHDSRVPLLVRHASLVRMLKPCGVCHIRQPNEFFLILTRKRLKARQIEPGKGYCRLLLYSKRRQMKENSFGTKRASISLVAASWAGQRRSCR